MSKTVSDPTFSTPSISAKCRLKSSPSFSGAGSFLSKYEESHEYEIFIRIGLSASGRLNTDGGYHQCRSGEERDGRRQSRKRSLSTLLDQGRMIQRLLDGQCLRPRAQATFLFLARSRTRRLPQHQAQRSRNSSCENGSWRQGR